MATPKPCIRLASDILPPPLVKTLPDFGFPRHYAIFPLCVRQTPKPVLVQPFLSETTTESFYHRIGRWLPRRLKSNFIPCRYYHWSINFDLNSQPATQITCGLRSCILRSSPASAAFDPRLTCARRRKKPHRPRTPCGARTPLPARKSSVLVHRPSPITGRSIIFSLFQIVPGRILQSPRILKSLSRVLESFLGQSCARIKKKA